MPTRRTFAKLGILAGVGIVGASTEAAIILRFFATPDTQTPLAGNTIPQFVEPLQVFAGARVQSASTTVQIQEFQQKMLPQSIYEKLSSPYNNGTYLWGYQVGNNPLFSPGYTLEALQGLPTTITYVNNLPHPSASKLLPQLTVDQTIHWADPLNKMGSTQPYQGTIPTVVHLHGAEVASSFDGSPEQWFTADGLHGKGYVTFKSTPANSAVYHYTNEQPATTLWFHDHSLGMTRINVFSGLAAFYLLRDKYDTGQPDNALKLPFGPQEVELIIQDRQFDTNGQLLFPNGTPEKNPTGLNGGPPNPKIHPYWIPEFFGDTILVNGKSWPYLEVEPRRYRFRLLNGSNARFYNMHLQDDANKAAGPAFWLIGTDGGLLDIPVQLNDPHAKSPRRLLLAPAERADVIIDFT
ncbi:MAG TPA: multicopper oxidase domain-containing protein, partial [Ktedonobacteraceae bacterium]|nr:multicopper oxidase domain-containing protein [Ktedonobacteraceae bacterium]